MFNVIIYTILRVMNIVPLWRMAGEDLSKDEHVDNEFLWNLKLLSEVQY